MLSKTNKTRPIASIILPVFNGEKYVREAIKSILDQEFSAFEFIIIDDGSTDTTGDIVNSFRDPRIIRIKNNKNEGIVYTLNRAIQTAQGDYIIRIDADDVSVPQRVTRQVDFMEKNPHISIAGSWLKYIGTRSEEVRFPVSCADVQSRMLLSKAISPSTTIMRGSDIRSKGLQYLEHYRYENEYHFYLRAIMAGLKIAHIPEILLYQRIHRDQMSTFFETRVQTIEILGLQKEYFSFLLSNHYWIYPRYLRCMLAFAYRRLKNRLQFSTKKIHLKIRELLYYQIPLEGCFHINCDARELKEKSVIDIATVAFNNPEVIDWQIKLLKKNMRDVFHYTVGDNSSNILASERIRALCESGNVAYIKLPKNHLTRSASHGSSLNWIYKNYMRRRKAHYFGFLDHDIFPTRSTSIVDMLHRQPLYGHLQERGDVWYLWAGFCFFRSEAVRRDANFLNGHAEGIAVDTGGMNWRPIYSKLNRKDLLFPASHLKKIRESSAPLSKINDVSLDMVEYIGDWMHIFGSSGWKTIRDQQGRDDKIREIIDALL